MAGSDTDIAEARAAAPPGTLLRASASSACIPWHVALLSSSQRIVALLLAGGAASVEPRDHAVVGALELGLVGGLELVGELLIGHRVTQVVCV